MKSFLSYLWSFALVLSFCSPVFAKRYQLMFDPNRIEEQVEKWAQLQPTTKEEWGKIVGERRFDTYQVKEGDWLSKISIHFFHSPKYWPKLWATNHGFISNPHQIEVGQILSLYREDVLRTPTSTALPVVKLLPQEESKAADLDKDSIINVDVKDRQRIRYFVYAEEELLGQISGSYLHKEYFYKGDDVYVQFENRDKVRVGETFALIGEREPLRDKVAIGSPQFGRLFEVLGEIRITDFGETLAKATIAGAFGAIKRGTQLVRMPMVVQRRGLVTPPSDLTARILMGPEPEVNLLYQGNLVILNKGADDGMKEGYFFRVFEDTDLRTQKRENAVEPESRGEIQVVYLGKQSSIGYVRKTRMPLEIGDTLVAAQLFKDPPFPPNREMTHIEME